jgi:hypothetical protein
MKLRLSPSLEATMFFGAVGIYALIGVVVAICLILYVFAKRVK